MKLGIDGGVACVALCLAAGCGGGSKGASAPGNDGGSSSQTATAESTTGQAGSGGSGSGGTNAACGSTPVEDGFVDVPATDPAVRYVGRFDFADRDAPRMTFPATTIETSFEAKAIDLRLDESAPGTSATSTQFYEVRIDDQAPVKLETCPGQEVYPLARDLAAGSHVVRVSKRTEGSVGSAGFLGFRIPEGASVALPEAPERRLEVVGDSITCGYGNEVSTGDPDSFKFTSTNENALLAYGAVAAGQLGADYVAVAASGRGMARNYSGGGALTAPEFYELSGPDASAPEWDHTSYSPDVIVVNLGTNDFSIGLSEEELTTMREGFRGAYGEFLTRLRELHPDASLIAAVGPMISDYYPEGYEAWTSIRADVQEVVDGLVEDGDSKVYYLEFSPQSSPYGEDWHPTVATHAAMANALAALIEEKLGW